MRQPADPTNAQEWQEAADLAEGLLAVESARLYGLVRGGPAVDVDRCTDLLARARARGVRPRPDAAEWLVSEAVKR